MRTFDLQNPHDLSLMHAEFDSISADEWDDYIELAEEKKLPFKSMGALRSAQQKAGLARFLSNKMISWVLSIKEDLDARLEDDERDQEATEAISSGHFSMPLSHITCRVAWHDNKWNGAICKDPEGNSYCNGFNSLLSERIRRRKEENLESELKYKGRPLDEIDYLPPCFWSVNLFGARSIDTKHDNPAASELHVIKEKLPARSLYSWPFAISFTRTQKEQAESGSYPKNLGEVRVRRFNEKVHEGKSIAFMYAKFSNPITEEDQQYLVVGAGLVTRKQKATEIPHFGPKSAIEEIKQNPKGNYKYRNFPSVNWAMHFSFEDYSTVRMPYHEYLEEAKKLEESDRDGFMDKIKVAITEPELEWCFKFVAMDIGDDEAIYILTKMRKALLDSRDEGVVPTAEMVKSIQKVDNLLSFAWSNRSYFPGFVSLSRALMNQRDEPKFPLEEFYEDFKVDCEEADEELMAILKSPKGHSEAKKYANEFNVLKDRLPQYGINLEQFLRLCMLNLRPFQFERILYGKLKLGTDWIRDFDEDVKRSHDLAQIIDNPYILHEDYEYWSDSHDDVYGEERDAPIDLFKIDIAYFPDTKYLSRLDTQRELGFVDRRRIRALILRHLKTLENTGDCFSQPEILQEVMRQYPLYYDIGGDYVIPPRLFHPLSSEYANHFREEPKKLVLVEENDTIYYYLAEIYEAEKNIEEKITTLLLSDENKERFPGLDSYLDRSLNRLKDVLTEKADQTEFRIQRDALYQNVFAKKFYILSGVAGSGKSYEILNILTHLEKEEGQKYLILAPTGKASLRLSSDPAFPNVEAFTIDKFITDVNSRKISHAKVREYKNVIIDETSMVDLLKMERLLAIFNFNEPSFKRLVLIGDPNQLPAIGYGRVLADLIEFMRSKKEYDNHYIRLETNCRAELKGNKILDLAESFMHKGGDLDHGLLTKFEKRETEISQGFRARYWSNKDELYGQLKEEFESLALREGVSGNANEMLNRLLGFAKNGKLNKKEPGLENFQILTPYRAQYSGSAKINDFIQTEFKKGLKFELRKNLFKEGDKLIRTKNYYAKKELVLSNGTLGFIMKDHGEKFFFESKGGIEEISFFDIRSSEDEFFELAYAISVHKSQGSGFNHLFLVLPERYGLLSKELVYTALTRTKKSITLFLQTSDEKRQGVLEIAAHRSFSASRRTSLMLDKPYRFYDLEPEKGVYVESRIELLIYHALMNKRKELGAEDFNFVYEGKPVVNGEELQIKTDFTVYAGKEIWYWEHLGLLGQRKYTWVWQNVKTPSYKDAGIWNRVITTDETNGISLNKIEELINKIVSNEVDTEEQHDQYSKHHYYLR